MRIQLVGKMWGEPDYNYPAFHAAADGLRLRGHEVFNPADSGGGDTTLPTAYYMRASLGGLLTAECVATLPGWQRSRNAVLEVDAALALDLPVVPVERLLAERVVPDGPDD
jgi:hypothetical protein